MSGNDESAYAGAALREEASSALWAAKMGGS